MEENEEKISRFSKSFSSDRIIFNHGSRSCIPEMIRPATETEIENKKRFMEQTP